MDFEIRKASAVDVPALSAILAEGDELHAAALPKVFRRPHESTWRAQTLAEALSNEDALVLVAVAHDQGARTMGMQVNVYRADDGRRNLRLAGVARGSGVRAGGGPVPPPALCLRRIHWSEPTRGGARA